MTPKEALVFVARRLDQMSDPNIEAVQLSDLGKMQAQAAVEVLEAARLELDDIKKRVVELKAKIEILEQGDEAQEVAAEDQEDDGIQ